MQPTRIFPTLLARWQKSWRAQDMSARLQELALQAYGYFLWTLVIAAMAGVSAVLLLPSRLVEMFMQFITIVYFLILMLGVNRLFQNNRTKYLLDKLEVIEDLIHDSRCKDGHE